MPRNIAKGVVILLGLGLVGWIADQGAWTREIVVSLAGNLGKPAVPFLRRALADEDNLVRQRARKTLIGIADDVVPTLTESLQDSDPQIRFEAARDMVIVAHHAKSAVPLLMEKLKNDPDRRVRKYAAMVLGLTGRDAQAAIPLLLETLHDTDADIRAESAEAVSLIGRHGEGREIINALLDALNDPAPDVREEAAEGLGRFGPRAMIALDSLSKATKDTDTRVRKEATEALYKLKGSGKRGK